MERGDIYIVPLDPTQGSEQQGTRPVLVVSPGPFNRLTGVPVVLPITQGGNFARTAGFAVSLMGAGTSTVGVVRCDQPRAIDMRARKGRKIESIPEAFMDEVLAKLATILECSSAAAGILPCRPWRVIQEGAAPLARGN